MDLALNDSDALDEDDNQPNQPASHDSQKWTVFVPQSGVSYDPSVNNDLASFYVFFSSDD